MRREFIVKEEKTANGQVVSFEQGLIGVVGTSLIAGGVVGIAGSLAGAIIAALAIRWLNRRYRIEA